MNGEGNMTDEYLQLVSRKAIGWIGSADSKAIGLLTIQAVLLGLVLLAQSSEGQSAIHNIAFWCFVVLTFISVAFCIATLWPRTNRGKILSESTNPILIKSPTFFKDVTKSDFCSFKKFAKEPKADVLRMDEEEQAFVLAHIATKKMMLIKWSIILVLASIFSLCVVGISRIKPSCVEDHLPSNHVTIYTSTDIYNCRNFLLQGGLS